MLPPVAVNTLLDQSLTTRPLVDDAPAVDLIDSGLPVIDATIDGQYRLRGVLGSGGMGTVYLANDEHLGRDVAIKVIHGDKLAARGMVDSFLHEARAMAAVDHPNVVTIHAFGKWDGRPYFVMERVQGPTLASWLRRHAPLDVVEAVELLCQICDAVEAVHESGTVHRDLKPGNVLIRPGGKVAVADFGLARPMTTEARRDDGNVSGTPAYLAPELGARSPTTPELTRRADVYSLGVIAFELLTGDAPYNARTVNALLLEHAFGDIPVASERRPELTTAFDDPLRRAIAKEPAERTASPAQLREELHAAAAKLRAKEEHLKVLLVDDHERSRDLVRQLLEMSYPSVEILMAADPRSAMAMAREQDPDLVITDLQMPHGGGNALTTALREDPATEDVPIVVMTGHGGAQEWRELRALGADRCILKPVDADALLAMIGTLTGRAPLRR